MASDELKGVLDERSKDLLLAATELIGRTGARDFTVAHNEDPEYGMPGVLWFAFATYPQEGKWEVEAATDPLKAVLRLAERLIDGGVCTHCGKLTGFDADTEDFNQLGTEAFVCWYQYDPELKVFRRGCE